MLAIQDLKTYLIRFNEYKSGKSETGKHDLKDLIINSSM
jgi:hypothetical protein